VQNATYGRVDNRSINCCPTESHYMKRPSAPTNTHAAMWRSILISSAAGLVAAGASAAAGLLTYTICGRLPAWIARHSVLAYANAIGDTGHLPGFSDRLHTMFLILGAIPAAWAAYSGAKAAAAAVRRRLNTRFALLPNRTAQR
jgi:hypothetical protein